MTVLLRLRLPHSMDFGNAKPATWGSHVRKPVTPARRAQLGFSIPSSTPMTGRRGAFGHVDLARWNARLGQMRRGSPLLYFCTLWRSSHQVATRGANSERYEFESGRRGGAKISALVFPQPRDRGDHRCSDTKPRAQRISRRDGDPLAQASKRCHFDSGQGDRHRQSDRLGPRRRGARRRPLAPFPRRRCFDLPSFDRSLTRRAGALWTTAKKNRMVGFCQGRG